MFAINYVCFFHSNLLTFKTPLLFFLEVNQLMSSKSISKLVIFLLNKINDHSAILYVTNLTHDFRENEKKEIN